MARAPRAGSAVIGKSGTWSPSDRPSSPASADSSVEAPAASACALTSDRTRSSRASSSSSAPLADTCTSRGAGAPGSCRPSSNSPNTGPAGSEGEVGSSISRPMPPSRACPGTGAASSRVIVLPRRIRPPTEPSSSGSTVGPPCFCARNSGMATVVAEVGPVVEQRRPRPMCRPSAGRSSTVMATCSGGSSSSSSGSQVTPLSVLRSSPPIASSMNAISASRCAGLASIDLRDCSGLANQSWFGSPSESNRPSALPSWPSTPKSSLPRLMASPPGSSRCWT